MIDPTADTTANTNSQATAHDALNVMKEDPG